MFSALVCVSCIVRLYQSLLHKALIAPESTRYTKEMTKFYDYIEALKRYTRLNANWKIAEYLGVSCQFITTLRYGKVWLSREKCLDIANALGIDPTEIVMTINAEKSQSPDEKKQWIALAEQHRKPINPPTEFMPDGSPRRRNKSNITKTK